MGTRRQGEAPCSNLRVPGGGMTVRRRELPPTCIPVQPSVPTPLHPRPFSGHRLPGSDRAWPAGPYPWSASGPGCSSWWQPCSPGAGNAGSLPPSAASLPPRPSVGTGELPPDPGLGSWFEVWSSRVPTYQDGWGGCYLGGREPEGPTPQPPPIHCPGGHHSVC